jgi:hypothetical protein
MLRGWAGRVSFRNGKGHLRPGTAAGSASISKPTGWWRDNARRQIRANTRPSRRGQPLEAAADARSQLAATCRGRRRVGTRARPLTMFVRWPTYDGWRGSAPLLHPVQAGHARCRTRSDHHPHKSLKSLSFILEENFTVTGTIEILQRYQRQVGVRSGLSKGFGTHGRIFPVAGRLSVPEVLDPLVMREGAP